MDIQNYTARLVADIADNAVTFTSEVMGEALSHWQYRREDVEDAMRELGRYRDLGTPEQLAARVEVVRCYDCRYWLHDIDVGHICGNTEKFTKRDDFCSYGERRK